MFKQTRPRIKNQSSWLVLVEVQLCILIPPVLNHDDGFMPVIINSKPQMIISSFDQFLDQYRVDTGKGKRFKMTF